MPRSTPSNADRLLVSAAAEAGVDVTARQLERWRACGLLHPNTKRAQGRGKGSSSVPAAGAVELVLWLGAHARPGHRPHHLALRAFGEGLAVPESTVRAAFESVVSTLRRATATRVSKAPVVPVRVRRIDRQVFGLVRHALGDADDGSRLSLSEFIGFGVESLTRGTGALDIGSLAAGARAFAPQGVPIPLAHDMEHDLPQAGNHWLTPRATSPSYPKNRSMPTCETWL